MSFSSINNPMNNYPSTNSSSIIKPRTDFDECYEFGTEIGKGRYATVKKCYCKKSRKCFAAKVIKNYRSKNDRLNLNIVENEIKALYLARSHPSIVNIYEVFQHKGETILILEYATEKDLHIYLECEGVFEEEKACHIIYQILKAIEFLHSKHVLHLDIKPENVLLMNPLPTKSNDKTDENNDKLSNNNLKQDIKVKLCDFSFSQVMSGRPILGMMGTVAYSAPEVLQYDELTKATDMWSLGVLTHVLLTEYTPFGNGTEKNNQTETNILSVREKDFECTEEYFQGISEEGKDFIQNLLRFKPKQRLTVEQALNHRWFKQFGVCDSTDSVQSIISSHKDSHSEHEMTKQFEQKPQIIIDETSILTTSFQNLKKNKVIEDYQTSESKISEYNLNLNEEKTSSPDQATSTVATTSKSSNEKIIENEDEKNNNLTTLIETVKIIETKTLNNLNNKNNENNSEISIIDNKFEIAFKPIQDAQNSSNENNNPTNKIENSVSNLILMNTCESISSLNQLKSTNKESEDISLDTTSNSKIVSQSNFISYNSTFENKSTNTVEEKTSHSALSASSATILVVSQVSQQQQNLSSKAQY